MPDAPSRAHAAALRLQAVAEEMLADVERLPADLITWRPADDVWSIMDILSHVEEFVPYWTGEISNVVHHPERAWGRDHTDERRLAAVQNTAARRLGDVAQSIRRATRASADAIGRLSDADLAVESTSRNPRWGVKPAHFILDHLLVAHVEKHLGQISRNVSQYQQKGQPAS